MLINFTGYADSLDQKDYSGGGPHRGPVSTHPSVGGETLQSILPSETSPYTAHDQFYTKTRPCSKRE